MVEMTEENEEKPARRKSITNRYSVVFFEFPTSLSAKRLIITARTPQDAKEMLYAEHEKALILTFSRLGVLTVKK